MGAIIKKFRLSRDWGDNNTFAYKAGPGTQEAPHPHGSHHEGSISLLSAR